MSTKLYAIGADGELGNPLEVASMAIQRFVDSLHSLSHVFTNVTLDFEIAAVNAKALARLLRGHEKLIAQMRAKRLGKNWRAVHWRRKQRRFA